MHSGIFLNSVTALGFYWTNTSPFRLVVCSNMFCDAWMLLYFLLWYTAAIFGQFSYNTELFFGLTYGTLDHYINMTQFVARYGSLYNSVLMAVNRFGAASLGPKYKTYFSEKRMKLYIVITFLLTQLRWITWPFGCKGSASFMPKMLTLIARNDNVCYRVILAVWGGLVMCILVFVLVLNSVSILLMRKARRQRMKNNAGNQTEMEAKRDKKNVLFLRISLANTLVSATTVLIFAIFSRFCSERICLFLTTNCTWMLAQSFNAVCILTLCSWSKLFNGVFRRNMVQPIPSVPTVKPKK